MIQAIKNTVKILLIFIVLIISQSLLACSYAYQYSLFPLGSSGESVIFLEVELERYVNIPGFEMNRSYETFDKSSVETRWKGNLKLKSSTDGISFKLLDEISYIDISDRNYQQELEPFFEKSIDRARRELFFEEADLMKFGNCAYDRSCNLFEMRVDSLKPALFCVLPKDNSSLLEVSFPQILLQKYENITQLNFSEIETVENESKVEFYKVWKPCSSRYYKVGDRELVVYCIGWGQKRGYNGIKDNQWKNNLLPVEKFIEGNDVMLHGQRFDMIKIL
jgi:hypothetical protein